jgi:hypothetical protein
VYAELEDRGFTVITVALDAAPDDARPWIETARPAHPALIDTRHVLADLYNIVNVPTIVWIDERGRIVRPNDVAFGADTFRHITGLESARHLTALRAWVRGEGPALSADEVLRHQPLPSAADQQARAEFALGQWLWARGRTEAATSCAAASWRRTTSRSAAAPCRCAASTRWARSSARCCRPGSAPAGPTTGRCRIRRAPGAEAARRPRPTCEVERREYEDRTVRVKRRNAER